MKAILIASVLALACFAAASKVVLNNDDFPHSKDSTKTYIEQLTNLKEVFDLGFIDKVEYDKRKGSIIDKMTGTTLTGEPIMKSLPQSNGTAYSPQLKFLLAQMILGLPRSYQDLLPTGENYWKTPTYLNVGAFDPWGNKLPLDSQIAIEERTLSHYGLNLYDGATWEIALALENLTDVAEVYERNVLYVSSTGANAQIGGLIDIRSDAPDYIYGSQKITGDQLDQITLPGNATRVIAKNGVPTTQTSHHQAGAYFYRMIGPSYAMTDPLDGNYANAWKYPYPNNDTTTPWNIAGMIHWNDWKPITGENVWACIMGPLQVLWLKNGTNMSNFATFDDAPSQVQLAISILPAIKALQSPLGSLYHCPGGTKMFPPDPSEQTNVSNENNFSSYAALTMLEQILSNFTKGTSDPVLTKALSDVQNVLQGLDKWFDTYLLSQPFQGFRVVPQGGHVSFAGVFDPVPINVTGGFAVDCQTWGMTVLGQARVDRVYGAGTAYQIWKATKTFAGYYTPSGTLGGVGYTIVDGDKTHNIWSAEWTWGAVNACRKLSYEYNLAGNTAYAQELAADALSMETEVQKPMIRCADGSWCGGGLVQEDGSYLYANDRFFIPWGWYANPVGATCSTAWAVMNTHKYNPFILGGGFVSPLA